MKSLKLSNNILTLAIAIGFVILIVCCCRHGCKTFYESLPKVKQIEKRIDGVNLEVQADGDTEQDWMQEEPAGGYKE